MSDLPMITGKRKDAVARIKIKSGNGIITVNNRDYKEYFKRKSIALIARQSLDAVSAGDKFDIKAIANGGGLSGQAGALRHSIARALVQINPEYRPILKKAGFLTRDPRVVERKKFGHKKARKSFQFSKR